MGIDVIVGIIVLIGVLLLLIVETPISRSLGLHLAEYQFGSKLMVAFLAGFILFVLLTDKMPKPGQKIPVIIFSLLLMWANLFLQLGQPPQKEEEGKENL